MIGPGSSKGNAKLKSLNPKSVTSSYTPSQIHTGISKNAFNASKATYGSMEHYNHLLSEGYYLDTELSNHNTKIFVHNSHIILAFRGTQDAADLGADAQLSFGYYGGKHFEAARESYNAVKEKYDREIVTTGHSLGGTTAIQIANENDLQSISFNPGSGFVPVNAGDHQVFVTDKDPISNNITGSNIHVSSGGHSTSNFESLFNNEPDKAPGITTNTKRPGRGL
jgi:hypothetical protein